MSYCEVERAGEDSESCLLTNADVDVVHSTKPAAYPVSLDVADSDAFRRLAQEHLPSARANPETRRPSLKVLIGQKRSPTLGSGDQFLNPRGNNPFKDAQASPGILHAPFPSKTKPLRAPSLLTQLKDAAAATKFSSETKPKLEKKAPTPLLSIDPNVSDLDSTSSDEDDEPALAAPSKRRSLPFETKNKDAAGGNGGSRLVKQESSADKANDSPSGGSVRGTKNAHIVCLSSRNRDKSDIHLRFFKEAVVKQVFLQIKALPFDLEHIKLPEDFSQEQLRLSPRHFSAHADSRAETERVQALEVIISKFRVV